MAKRTKALRIATVGDLDASIEDRLVALPGKQKRASFDDLYGDFADLVAFRPHVVLVPAAGVRDEDLGVLRLLRVQGPKRLEIVLCAPRGAEPHLTRTARLANAVPLVTPCSSSAFAAAIDRAEGRPRDPSRFLDVARGVADEIGNPLMFATGHAQLLDATVGSSDSATRDQIRAILSGLDRINQTLEKVRSLAEVHDCTPPLDAVPLATLFENVLRDVDVPDDLQIRIAEDARPIAVRGDAKLLTRALRGLLEVAAELHRAGRDVRLAIDPLDQDLRIRLRVRGDGMEDFESGRSFEPYHLNRALRGTAHGLTLFVVQSIVHAHGGRAFAKRVPNGGTRLEVQLAGAV